MTESLKERLRAYKKKFYLNQLLKGVLIGLALVVSVFVAVSVLEYYNNFGRTVRTILFLALAGTLAYVLFQWVGKPLFGLATLDKSLSDEEAAQQIGRHFPEVKDKLLNTLQLEKLNKQDNSLIAASLKQRTQELRLVRFATAVNFKANGKYLKYSLPPLLLLLLLLGISPQLFTKSTTRIIRFNQDFIPEAPFQFVFESQQDKVFKGEAFPIQLGIEGDVLPEQAYVFINGHRHKMKQEGPESFSYSHANPQDDFELFFEAAGFQSAVYPVELVERPKLISFDAKLDFPAYLGKKDRSISNVGTFSVPEGTIVTWLFKESAAEELSIRFANGESKQAKKAGNGLWELSKQMKATQNYDVRLKNQHAENKDQISFTAEVIPDRFPEIEVERYSDSTLYSYLILGGRISDDYGLRSLKLMYRVKDEKGQPKGKFQVQGIPIQSGQSSQQFFYQWDINKLKLKNGESLDYYLMVWDNDAVNGSKSARSRLFQFNLPNQDQIEENLEASAEKTEKEMDKTLEKAKELNNEIKDLKERVKGKRKLDWQDQKMAEQLLDKQKNLQDQIDKLKEQYKMNDEMQKRFNENPQLQEKMQRLQEMMDQLLDEETKKKFEELEKLLQEQNQDPDNLKKMLEQMEKKDFNLEKELDRAMELFKQLKLEQKMSQTANKLDSLAKEQKKLAEESKKLEEDKKGMSKQEKEQKAKDLQEKQEDIKKEFEDVKEDLKKLDEMNEDLEKPNEEMDQMKEEQEKVSQEMQESQQNMQKDKMDKAGENQEKAGDEMQEMADQMQQSLSMMQKQQMEEDMEAMRQLLENLITLSFDQEELMKEFQQVRQRDPRFVELGQQQLKLRDDAKIIEDSLMALAKRVFQINSFVTREVTDMNDHMEGAIDGIKERRKSMAAGKQQLAMTSINNLALLLSDVLDQMQQSMAQQMKGNQNCNKPGNKSKPGQGKKPSLSKMQQQLNQQIESLKKSGKSGRQLSEELAKMAAQQEAIRKAMKEMEQAMEGGKEKPGGKEDGGKEGDGQEGSGGNSLKEIQKKMEETEEDLVNKRITEETINRQREIMTRLLESEKAMKEREWDQKRESRTGKELTRQVPPNFEKYLKAKEKQVELLKTISPALTPFYKEESNRYFKELSE